MPYEGSIVTDKYSGLGGSEEREKGGGKMTSIYEARPPKCPLEYIDPVYIGTTLTDGRFIG